MLRMTFAAGLVVALVGCTGSTDPCSGDAGGTTPNATSAAGAGGSAEMPSCALQCGQGTHQQGNECLPDLGGSGGSGDGGGSGGTFCSLPPGLGTPGSHFAGTSCWCDTTLTTDGMTTEGGRMYVSSGYQALTQAVIDHRQVAANGGCEIYLTGGALTVRLMPDGNAEIPPLPFGIQPPDFIRWTCDEGTFRVVSSGYAWDGRYVSGEGVFEPPLCTLFECGAGQTCEPDGLCWRDGTVPSGKPCSTTSNCEAGLTCAAGPNGSTCQ